MEKLTSEQIFTRNFIFDTIYLKSQLNPELSINEYNEMIDEINAFIAEIHFEIAKHYWSKDENWHKSKLGLEYEKWMNCWNKKINRIDSKDDIYKIDPDDYPERPGIFGKIRVEFSDE